MNTPEPCATCKHCQYNRMEKNDENASAWCGLGTTNWGNIECPKYENYKTRDNQELLNNCITPD